MYSVYGIDLKGCICFRLYREKEEAYWTHRFEQCGCAVARRRFFGARCRPVSAVTATSAPPTCSLTADGFAAYFSKKIVNILRVTADLYQCPNTVISWDIAHAP